MLNQPLKMLFIEPIFMPVSIYFTATKRST
jgi:hypothetical protein